MKRRDFIGAGLAGAAFAGAGARAQAADAVVPASAPGLLRRVVASEVTSLDPQRPTGQVTAELAAELFCGLTAPDAGGRIGPGCAESWKTSADGREWSFTLRRGMAWSDGTPLDARDFVYTLQRYLAPETGAANATRLDAIVGARDVRLGKQPPTALGVSAPSPTTLVIRLERPDIELPISLATAYCVPQHVVRARGREWAKPGFIVSNGAYRLDAWAAGAKDIRLRRNARFHDAARVAIERVDWLTGYDDGTRLRLFRLGEVDVAAIEDLGSLDIARRELAAFLRSSPECALGAVGFNLERPAWQRVETRRALALAIDRATLATRVRGLGERPWEGVVPPGIPGYPAVRQPPYAAWPRAKRLETARSLRAGQPPLKVGIGFPASATGRKVYLAVAAMVRPIGIEIELQPLEGRAYTAAIQRGEFDLFSYGSFAEIPSATGFLERFESDAGTNVTRYRAADFDRVYRRALAEPTLAGRQAAYGEAEALLQRDLPLVPLWAGASNRLVSARVRGWIDHPGHAQPSQHLKFG